MTSHRQIEANRRNARKSTGPITEEGKQLRVRFATDVANFFFVKLFLFRVLRLGPMIVRPRMRRTDRPARVRGTLRFDTSPDSRPQAIATCEIGCRSRYICDCG
jgi:hypothetical protein